MAMSTASAIALPRPAPGDFDPGAAGYVAIAPLIHDASSVLTAQRDLVKRVVARVTADRAGFRYAPDKWTIQEVMGHLSDAERVFSYRLLRVGRGDATPLPGFDETTYVPAAAFGQRSLRDVLDEWVAVRTATIALICGLPRESWAQRGIVNERPVTAAALVYIIVGHVEHHLAVLRDRYDTQ
jgi:hypothetical protein